MGGGAGQSILKSLCNTEFCTVAADGENLATGLYMTKRKYVIPYADSKKYISSLIKICRQEKIKILFPGLDAELAILSKYQELFKKEKTCVVVSNKNVIDICDDKLLTAEWLRDKGFPYPKTVLFKKFENSRMSFPLILKPRKGGARSKGVKILKGIDDLKAAKKIENPDNYVVQEYIEGQEYTCGSITLNGKCSGAIIARRTLRDGDTYKAFIERNKYLESFISRVANELQPFGPCNMQLRIRNKVPFIFEINARCSGTTYCRTLAGFNEPAMLARFLCSGEKPNYKIRPITILRYWNELPVANNIILKSKQRKAFINKKIS